MGACVEKTRLVLQGHLVPQPQRPLHRHTGVAEINVVKSLRLLAVDISAVKLHNLRDLISCEIPSLVPKTTLVLFAAAGCPHIACVKQLDPAFAPLFLTVCDDPDVGANAGVVEHLLGQRDNGLQPIFLDDPLADVALTRTSAASKERRAAEHYGEA